jgi:hypothetical protein
LEIQRWKAMKEEAAALDPLGAFTQQVGQQQPAPPADTAPVPPPA